jgi:hypothetical protein
MACDDLIQFAQLARELLAIGELPTDAAAAAETRRRLRYPALWVSGTSGEIPMVRCGNRLAVPRAALPDIARAVGLTLRGHDPAAGPIAA